MIISVLYVNKTNTDGMTKLGLETYKSVSYTHLTLPTNREV